MKKYFTFLINIFIPHFAGIIGSYFTIHHMFPWYDTINKAPFNPPKWVFSPVWLTLYTLIGIAFYLFHRKNSFKNTEIYWVYGVHIVLNALWSILFFGMHSPVYALADLALLIASLLFIMLAFYRSNRVSFTIMLIYFSWLCFAFVLNFYIILFN